MTLQPVTGLLATVVNLADKDQDAADELVRLGLYEALQDQIEAQRPVLDAGAYELIAKRAHQARAHLLREYVGKALDSQQPVDATQTAQNLAVLDEYVSKGRIREKLKDKMLALFEEQHPRGPGGQWIKAGVGGVPKNARSKAAHNASATQEAKQHLRALQARNEIGPGAPVKLVLSNEKGDGKQTVFSTTSEFGHDVDRNDGYLREVHHQPGGGHTPPTKDIPRSAFDATMALTGSAGYGSHAGRKIPEEGKFGEAKTDQVAGDWNNLTEGTDRQSYRRLALTGQALQNASIPGSYGHAAGGVARIVGGMGPEAERVLGPGFARTAYRYRGTEKRPDKSMIDELKLVNRDLTKLNPASPESAAARQEIVGDYGGTRRGVIDPALGSIGATIDPVSNLKAKTFDQTEMMARGDVIATSLVQTLPDPALTKLNQSSGDTPPSQGVIINADGKIVSQSQGFNGDHYLPFDLKNLKSLNGGQYVRTRATGGPTTEDIYTGLLSGARQIQVVSHSGVYTVEMDPDLRGGRRYSDKATKMVQRYGRILDAISSGEVMRQDIPAEVKQREWNKAMERMHWDEAAGRTAYNAAIDRLKLKSSMGMTMGLESVPLAEQANTKFAEEQQDRPGLSKPDEVNRKNEIMAELRSTQAQPYKLDGEGYHSALLALQQEFPYYIREVRYKPLPEFYRQHLMGEPPKGHGFDSDKAYVPPGQTTPGYRSSYMGASVAQGAYNSRANQKKRKAKEPEEDASTGRAGFGAGASTAVAGRSTQETGSLPAGSFGNVAFKPHKDTKPLSAVTGADSEVSDLLGQTIRPLMHALEPTWDAAHGIDSPLTGETLTPTKPEQFTLGTWKNISGDKARSFANWLLTTATPEEQEAVAQTVSRVPEYLAKVGDDASQARMRASAGGDDKTISTRIADAVSLISLASPWAAVSADKALAKPDTGDFPKPQPLGELDALGNKLSNYAEWEDGAASDNPQLLAQIKAYASKSDIEIASDINDGIRAAKKPDQSKEAVEDQVEALELKQMAWSYKTAKKLAAVVDEGPKAKAATAAPEVKKSHDPYRQAVQDLVSSYSPQEVQAYLDS